MRAILAILPALSFMLFPFFAAEAETSTSVQMLPPIQSTNTSSVCSINQGNKLLSWDGANSIKCNYGITTDGTGRTNLSRDNTGECCSNGNYTLSIAENTAASGRMASIQFHNGGVHEGFLRLAPNGVRRFQMGDYQGVTTGLQITGGLQVDGVGVSSILGPLGIGTTAPTAKLDVVGGVKIANDAAVCNATKAGTIRWTGAAFQGCNGSAWIGLGGGTVKVDYPTCGDAYHDYGTGLSAYYTQWGATGSHNINLACPKDYVLVGMDHNEVTGAYCCKLKIE